jgi:hypothetical protein
MQAIAVYISLFISLWISLLVAFVLPLLPLTKQFKAAEEKAHARRLADARMNARLLRFNL